MQDIDTLSTSFERLSISNTRPPPLENDQILRKNNICFKLKNSNEWKTATLMSRSGKATSKYKKAWNSESDDGTMQSSDHERAIVSLGLLPKSSASKTTNLLTNTEEVLCSKIYLNELESRIEELGKKQEVYGEEEGTIMHLS